MSNLKIQRRSNAQWEEAKIVADLELADLVRIEAIWQPERTRVLRAFLDAGIPVEQIPRNVLWNWTAKEPLLKKYSISGRLFGIDTVNDCEGLMFAISDLSHSRLESKHGIPILYVSVLEVAPWNWNLSQIQQSSRYRAIGTLLFDVAMMWSFELGFQGRIGLHSLPDPEPFYQQLGMTDLGPGDGSTNASAVAVTNRIESTETNIETYLSLGA